MIIKTISIDKINPASNPRKDLKPDDKACDFDINARTFVEEVSL